MLDFLHTLTRGGVVMIPLGICSLASVTVLLERFFFLRKALANSDSLAAGVTAHMKAGNLEGALEVAQSHLGPVASVLARGLRAALMGAHPQEAMSEEAMTQLPALQRRLVVLDTVVTIAPLLGLLGTVMGMISSFRILSVSGTEQPMGITSGIAEALVATATGLVIAIFSLVGFNWCQEKVKTIVGEMDRRATQLLNWLTQVEKENEVTVRSF